MIEYCVCEAASLMADTTILVGCDVAGVLFGDCTRRTVSVTLCTVIHPASVIKHRVSEAYGVMAHTAVLAGGRVSRRLT